MPTDRPLLPTGHYFQQPTTSSVTPEVPTSFPSIVYCPLGWASRDKLDRYDITDEELMYLQSLFNDLFKVEVAVSTNPQFNQLYKDEKAAKKAKQGLEEKQRKYFDGKLNRMFRAIAYDVDDLFKDLQDDITVELVFTIRGLCWRLTKSQKLSRIDVTISSWALQLRQPSNTTILNVYVSPDLIMMGDMADGINPTAEALIVINRHYTVKIAHFHTNHADIRRRHCKASTRIASYRFMNMSQCLYDCVNREMCVARDRCILYTGQEELGIKDMCSVFHFTEGRPLGKHCFEFGDSERSLPEEVVTRCERACIVPCEMLTYDITAIPFAWRQPYENASIISVGFADPLSRYRIDESLIYDFPTLVSNVGGAVGLWCGASIVSFVEILYFFTCRPLARSMRKVSRFVAK